MEEKKEITDQEIKEAAEKLGGRVVSFSSCPIHDLHQESVHLFEQLCKKGGEPPDLQSAYWAGLMTGAVAIADKIGLPHSFKEFSLIFDEELMDA